MLSKMNLWVYDWNNGVMMMGVFVLVCVILLVALIVFMAGGKRKEE